MSLLLLDAMLPDSDSESIHVDLVFYPRDNTL
jgi:hypothetical protein